MTLDLLIEQCWRVTLVIHAFLLLRLLTMRRRPAHFCRWAIFGFGFSFVGSFFGVKSPTYYSMYVVGQIVDVILSLFVTKEILQQTYAEYPGLPFLGTRLLRWSALNALGCAVLAIPLTSRWWSSPYYQCIGFGLAEMTRFLLLTYISFIIAMYYRLHQFPIKIGAYTRAHGSLWLLFMLGDFLTRCIGLYFHNKHLNMVIDVYLLGQGMMCYTAWIVLFCFEPVYTEETIHSSSEGLTQASGALHRLNELYNLVLRHTH